MFGLPDHPVSRLVNLSFNVGQALRVPWLQYPRSIGGDWGSLTVAPTGFETELAALRPWFTRGSVETILRGVGVPWPLSRVLTPRVSSGPIEHPGRFSGRHPDQAWFFLNGICTDRRLALVNAELLANVFERPFTILYNATEGLVLDLLECAIGKAWEAITEVARENLDRLLESLCDPAVTRVVLISHSQGTIVAAVLLKALEEMLRRETRHREELRESPPPAGEQKVSPERRAAQRIVDERGGDGARSAGRRELQPRDIGKLELYCFANCATSMEPFVRVSDPARVAPWIESFGNENDLVAKLGLLAPPHGIGSARIAGDRYRVPKAWGHLFNAHYGLPILVQRVKLEGFHDNVRAEPRLFEYLYGETPGSMP